MTPYIQFNRNQWTALHDSVPMTLTEGEIVMLKGINEDLSLAEVAEIYLPLSHLLNFYITFNLHRQTILEQFLGTNKRTPYIISISGSVAVGKSTTARILQALLSRWPEHRSVELITTDGFLYPNEVLKKRGLMKKKGFPLSYDMYRLVKFVFDLKSGMSNVTAPVYSHLIYNRIPDGDKTVIQPDILILEGLNVLQSRVGDYPHDPYHMFVSDFVDFSIYVDAPEYLLQNWYINRFLKFREGASTDPNSYFYNYSKLSKEEAISIATSLWQKINYINLKENILPTRERANLILTKSKKHLVDKIRLRKSPF